jgi:septal ring factor EnvC (AmiA/AmiB activator)
MGLVSLMLAVAAARAETATDMTKQLQAVDKQITAIQATLSNDKVKRGQLEKDLQKTDIAVGQVAASLHSVDKELGLQAAKLAILQQQKLLYQQQLTEQQNALASQIRAAYFMGQQNYFKLLLNQQNPTAISRNMTYFKYFNQHRVELINKLATTVTQLQQNEAQIVAETQTLRVLRQQQQLQQQQLIQAQTTRQQLLTRLNQQITTNTQQLSTLTSNKKNLQNLIDNLQRQAAQTPMASLPIPFAKLKGALPWPTHGSISMHYNTPIDGSELLSNGVVIRAPEGQNVYSIYPGHVLFAGWLKGFGLLMIIDHGNGYMSLYGRNQGLFKKVGQDVNAGDLIAQVGESGGFSQSALYFEIRYNGDPVNPETWCK